MRLALALAALVASLAVSTAEARPFSRIGRRARTSSTIRDARCDTSSCAGVAQHMAATGRMGHYGNPTGTYEGVGSSTTSAQDALDRCCYSNSGMTVVDSAAACGPHGCYAIKRYAPPQ